MGWRATTPSGRGWPGHPFIFCFFFKNKFIYLTEFDFKNRFVFIIYYDDLL